MTEQHIVFIGAGNMARALISGMRQRDIPGESIQVHAPSTLHRGALAEEFGVRSRPAQAEKLPENSVVIYAAKPKQMPAILQEWGDTLRSGSALFVSVAAGVSSTQITALLGEEISVVRAMPNTPSQIGAGATTLFARANVGASQCDTVQQIFSGVGKVFWLHDEALMDTATALAGSGPAYVLLFLEALEDAAVLQGLDRITARALALQTVLGTAQMAAASPASPSELRHQVTSPGGTTAAGLAVWEEQLRPLAQRALAAAAERGRALSQLLKKDA
ncbi:pyrroline-5-carboxylate reductase [Acidithiobacillus montserratensis]|uniref:Pyrroline-5-carboxylate reductase n=1 Tax=Acidithiobacillus montserratensis TaxID=2729135 RepID=A0ACD5HFQ6_9PROT|nr:pyrroline-5-carboxylate reductase [Acidithiobacillus montserratensis]MBN2680710.1 pyrroline-5-carboxylate reductase [Acidithiobacillaceae bacterium]MBU2747525.1 pyrroline-5-carboxylate reductase [Acidithiobacillus montserratensis]